MTEADPFLVLATVLVGGTLFGMGAKRLHLPAITGQIVVGVLLGKMGLDLFSEASISALHPVTEFALGLMAVSVGAHLDLRRLRPMRRRLGLLLLFEVLLVTSSVTAAVVAFEDLDLGFAILLGTIGVATAPATVVALVKETRSKGVLVNTLIAGVGLNNLACIFLFEVVRSVLRSSVGGSAEVDLAVFTSAGIQIGEAAAAGALTAVGMLLIARFVKRAEIITTAGFVAILLCVGLANHFGFSSMLACLFLGLAQANVTHSRDEVVDSFFHSFEPAILAAFFTLAGMELTLEHAAAAGVTAAIFFVARLFAKLLAGSIAMRLAGATHRIRDRLGLAMIPQAGVAVGLVVLLEEDPILHGAAADTVEMIVAVVLTAVVMNEVVGPILTRLSLTKSGEAGQDHRQLMDFIREEHIVTDFHAETMEEAIGRLVRKLAVAQHLTKPMRTALREGCLAREEIDTTCIGGGIAVPHTELDGAKGMKGVMAISREGFDIPTPDGEPVHCILLLGYPKEEESRKDRVLTLLGRTIGRDAQVRHALANARTPSDVHEVLLDAGVFETMLEEPEEPVDETLLQDASAHA